MTDMIMELIDERRKPKRKDHQRYQFLNCTIHRECLTEKKSWMEERCIEVEDLDKKDNHLMYYRRKNFLTIVFVIFCWYVEYKFSSFSVLRKVF